MASRTAAPQDRAAVLDASVRELLAAGNPRAARQAGRQELERAAKALHDADPARGAQCDAWLAGVFAAVAAGLPGFTPPGYRPGPPSAAQLIAIYETARSQTARQQ